MWCFSNCRRKCEHAGYVYRGREIVNILNNQKQCNGWLLLIDNMVFDV
jgi:hypothetical protein